MNLSGFFQENKKYHLQLCKGYWVSDILGMPGYRPNWITRGSVTIYNHNCDKICDMLGFFKIRTKEISRVFWLVVKKKNKSYKCMSVIVCTVQLLRHDAYCPISAEIRTVDIP